MNARLNADLCELPQIFIVEASAGSGKTYALAKRYLNLLINQYLKANDVPLRNILAITFTKKAAVEMKERILELLKKIALDSFTDKTEEQNVLDVLKVDKNAACAKARVIMDELIRHYDFFQVQTIDSFINSLLLGSALNIDRSARFAIKKDYTRYLSYCLDLVIDQAADNAGVSRLIDEFLKHYLFVENRRGWFPKDDIQELMKSFVSISNRYGGVFRTYEGESKNVIKKKRSIYKKISLLSGQLPENMNKTAARSITTFVKNNEETFETGNLPLIFHKPFVPMNKNNDCPADFGRKWKEMHNEIKDFLEMEAQVAYTPYVKLFQKLFISFQEVSKKEDILFLEELNRKARLLFDNEGVTVAELYYRLAARFAHYLIDEFQDTSLLQWNNLEMMVEDALSRGGSLFYVGDKKQAIYRFRGGESNLFDGVRKKFGHFKVKTANLTKNWRSHKAIVEFNNAVFSEDNLNRAFEGSGVVEDLGEGSGLVEQVLDVFKDSTQQYKKGNDYGYVKVEYIDESNQDERDEITQAKILSLIEQLKSRSFRYEDIAILTRDNKEVELVTSWLLEAGYPVESEKTLNVLENPLIKEMVSFLKFLYSPIDDLNFASFILGQIFSRVTGISIDEISEFIFRLRRNKEKASGVPLYRMFRYEYRKVWDEFISMLFKNVGFVSTYELVTAIYRKFNISINFEDAQAFFMKFLELIKNKEDDYSGLGDFLESLKDTLADDLYVNAAGFDSVRILTIHKSKGLEFPVVIIPFLRMEVNPESGGKGTNSYLSLEDECDIGLVRITKVHRLYSFYLREIYVKHYVKAFIDELNSIYVAMTRPQMELYIYVPKKSGSSNNKARFLMPDNLYEKGTKIVYNKDRKVPRPLINILPSNCQDWIKLIKEEFSSLTEIRSREKIAEGNVLHAMLSKVGNCLGLKTVEILEDLREYLSMRFPFLKDSSSYVDKISELLRTESLKDIFYVTGGLVECEKEVVCKTGTLKRIDRFILKKEEIIIVEYKTSKEGRENHLAQIEDYIGIIKDIYKSHKVKGFIIYLNELSIEEICL